jgi:hypothetical protein
LSRQDRSGHGFGSEAREAHFIAKTREFLERLRSCEFPGREEYESQIERDLQDLRRSQTKEESEKIVNGICLKVAIACYALKAHERASGREKPNRSDR